MNVKLIPLKIKEYKSKIVIGVKTILLIFILFSVFATFEAPYTKLIKIFPSFFITFLMLSIIYYTFTSNEKDRSILMSMWKTYFPVITLMVVLIFSIESDVTKARIDYLKTKLDYDIKIESPEIAESFSTYDKTIDNYFNKYKREDCNISKFFKEKQPVKDEKPYKIWYANFSVSVMNIVTLFMFIWGLSELSFFSDKKSHQSIKKTETKIRRKFLKLP